MTAKEFIAKLREVIQTEICTEKIMTQPPLRTEIRVNTFLEVLETIDQMEKYYCKEVSQ